MAARRLLAARWWVTRAVGVCAVATSAGARSNGQDPYATLGVSRSASEEEIRKAYKRKAAKAHPDKGGDAEEFKRIASAYATLSDPSKKAQYDRFGTTSPGGGGGFSFGSGRGGGGTSDDQNLFDAFKLFDEFVGGGGGGTFFSSGPRRPRPRIIRLELRLEDLYRGGEFRVRVPRQRACATCGGAGGKVQRCEACGGQGYVVTDRRFGGYVQRVRAVCGTCSGAGAVLSESCSACGGRGLASETREVVVKLAPGAEAGHRVTFSGEGDDILSDRGVEFREDVVVVVAEAEHPELQRVGSDLFVAKRVSLLDALTGCCLDLPDLAGSRFIATPEAAALPVAADDVLVVRRLGMPDKDTGKRGHLYVRVLVDFPNNLPAMDPADRRKLLAQALGGDPDFPAASGSKSTTTKPARFFLGDFFGSDGRRGAGPLPDGEPRIARRAPKATTDRLFRAHRGTRAR